MVLHAVSSKSGFQKPTTRSAGLAARLNFQSRLRDRVNGDLSSLRVRAESASAYTTMVANGGSVPSCCRVGSCHSGRGFSPALSVPMDDRQKSDTSTATHRATARNGLSVEVFIVR